MPAIAIKNIKSLVNVRTTNALLRGNELAHLPSIENAYLVAEDGIIAEYGAMSSFQENTFSNSEIVDAAGRFVFPAWCDSHTHLVFAAPRESEFVDKIRGLSYAEIAAKGGGILNSAKKLNAASEDELFSMAWNRLEEISRLGTGSVEIKSGYGLTLDGELKMLRVIRKLKEKSSLNIRATFLGAHALPLEYKENREGYLDLVIHQMLPAIAAEQLADYIDVFCEQGFFSPQETERICLAGKSYGVLPKLHANQLHVSGGVQTGVALGALSVDHLETMDDDAVNCLAGSNTIGTLLPTAAYFIRLPFPPARQLINSGCALALASDYNPGSSPSGNMNQVVSMACIGMRMLPEEAINAATINGAFAMGLQDVAGSIMIGKKSHLVITKPIPSVAYFPYSFGTNLIERVLIGENWIS